MNRTDQALLLCRRLIACGAPGRLRYRAYLRWVRRSAQEPGTIAPSSIASRADWGCRAERDGGRGHENRANHI